MPGFTIPGISGGGGGNTPKSTMETARQHRWTLTVLPQGGDQVRLYASKCDRPIPEIDVIKIHHGQDEISIAGKNRWAPIHITFYEIIAGSDTTAQFLNDWAMRKVILIHSSKQGSQFSYKQSVELQMEDGFGKAVWTYKIYDAWPSKVSPTTVDYSDINMATIECTLEFSKAEEKAGYSSEQAAKGSC